MHEVPTTVKSPISLTTTKMKKCFKALFEKTALKHFNWKYLLAISAPTT